MNTEIQAPLFRQAVAAIGTGDIAQLELLLTNHPNLVTERTDYPGEAYFNNPYLLWFVADNPIGLGKLPGNILEVTALLIDTIKKVAGGTMQEQMDYALVLVATGRVPRECGVQLEMIDMLIDAGAQPGDSTSAIAQGNIEAAVLLIKRGSKLTLAAAVALNLGDEINRMAPVAKKDEQLAALTVAAFYGNTEIIAYLLKLGTDPNGYPEGGSGFHPHATPLHQAVCSRSLVAVQLLVEAGADLNAKDKAYDGTPLDWAMYLPREDGCDETAKSEYKTIETYLITAAK